VSIDEQQGLIGKRSLVAKEIAEIRALASLCEQEEQLHMRIDWTLLQRRDGQQVNDFLYYSDGRLVGYLGLDGSGGSPSEVVGMVDPAYRRRGICSSLLKAAFAECRTREQPYLILICERSSRSGQAFMRALDATYSESEHEMWLTAAAQKDRGGDDRLSIRPFRSDELDALVLAQAESFGEDKEYMRERVLMRLQQPNSRYYLAVLGTHDVGCEEPVGACRLDYLLQYPQTDRRDRANRIPPLASSRADNSIRETPNRSSDFALGESVGIYSFGVRSAYQGRGYGRQILTEMIRLLHEQGQQHIMLDVESNNTRAFNLYSSLGFTIYATYDYYILAA
jgi:Acetyltransferases